MAKDPPGEDLAVVMFSGHGEIIGNRLYLLPYGVDAATQDQIEATAISGEEFREKVTRLAEHGHRVLVLLDACHSGAVSNVEPDLDKLSKGLAASNVSVLTSSSSKEISREDPAWQNGAFTKVLMEALGRYADEDHDGLISMTELAHYMSRHLPAMTANRQHLGLEVRFESNLFVAGL
jgi:uncharacterized caspase-like protein